MEMSDLGILNSKKLSVEKTNLVNFNQIHYKHSNWTRDAQDGFLKLLNDFLPPESMTIVFFTKPYYKYKSRIISSFLKILLISYRICDLKRKNSQTLN